jgi:hypothetical protein
VLPYAQFRGAGSFPRPTPHFIFESLRCHACLPFGKCCGAWKDHGVLHSETLTFLTAETLVSSPLNATDHETPRGLYNDFLKWFFLVTAIAWLLLALPLYLLGEANILWGAIAGCCLPALCFVIGFYSMCRNLHRPPNQLMIAFVGGMLARMLFIGLTFFLILWLTQLHVASLLTSLFGFYILYLVLELYFVNGRFKHIKEGQQWA